MGMILKLSTTVVVMVARRRSRLRRRGKGLLVVVEVEEADDTFFMIACVSVSVFYNCALLDPCLALALAYSVPCGCVCGDVEMGLNSFHA